MVLLPDQPRYEDNQGSKNQLENSSTVQVLFAARAQLNQFHSGNFENRQEDNVPRLLVLRTTHNKRWRLDILLSIPQLTIGIAPYEGKVGRFRKLRGGL